jgi:hypothetical protein
VAAGREDEVGALAEKLLALAESDLRDYSPVYDRLATALAGDPEALAAVAGVVSPGKAPVLLLAVTHDMALAEPAGRLARLYRGADRDDPWPTFRSLLLERTAEVRAAMAARTVQTNEVGRSAALLPAVTEAVARVDGDRPVALVEIGPSAGLNLFFDRFSVTYLGADATPLVRAGPTESPVRLTCEVRSALPPLPTSPLDIVRREGIDPNPIDVTDPVACRWLSACIWPGVPDRADRLEAAITVARRDPPVLHRGDARTDLAPLLAAVPDATVPIVIATWALAYLDGQGRRDVCATVDALGRDRDVALVTAESPHVTPWVDDTEHERTTTDGDGTATLLGLRQWRGGEVETTALGWMHPHGRWLDWGERR